MGCDWVLWFAAIEWLVFVGRKAVHVENGVEDFAVNLNRVDGGHDGPTGEERGPKYSCKVGQVHLVVVGHLGHGTKVVI